MKKLKLYLETSVWNFIYADDAPEKRDLTHEFFNVVKKGVYDIYASEIVINEIQRADLKKRQKLMKEIRHLPARFAVAIRAVQPFLKRLFTPRFGAGSLFNGLDDIFQNLAHFF